MEDSPWGLTFDGLEGHSLMLGSKELDAVLGKIPLIGRFLEIGTFSGVSAAYWADRRMGVQFLCLDTFFCPEAVKFCPSNWLANRRKNMNLFVGTSQELERFVHPGSFDTILVDGDHKEVPVLADLRIASRLLKPGGTILAHDYSPKPHMPVVNAVNKFCEDEGWALTKLAGSLVALVSD